MTVLSVSADQSEVFGDENGTCGPVNIRPLNIGAVNIGARNIGAGRVGDGYFEQGFCGCNENFVPKSHRHSTSKGHKHKSKVSGHKSKGSGHKTKDHSQDRHY